MTALVTTENLIAEYPGVRALDAVSIAIEAGSITALVGPNGAGKTTLMRCLCGLERPVDGSIQLAGIDVIEHPRASHQFVGFLPDFLGLYDELTVAQCLSFAARANGVEQDVDTRVNTLVEQLGLTARLAQRVGELSRGLRQRVAIGQAIVHQPRLLILDEPASGLDPEARHALSQLFKALRAMGMTLLVSSHILAELEDYATHMLVLRDGRVIEQRALGALTGQVTLGIGILSDPAQAHALLSKMEGVVDVVVSDSEIRCGVANEPAIRAKLLATLIAQGVQITRFIELGADLQQSYLATLHKSRAHES